MYFNTNLSNEHGNIPRMVFHNESNDPDTFYYHITEIISKLRRKDVPQELLALIEKMYQGNIRFDGIKTILDRYIKANIQPPFSVPGASHDVPIRGKPHD